VQGHRSIRLLRPAQHGFLLGQRLPDLDARNRRTPGLGDCACFREEALQPRRRQQQFDAARRAAIDPATRQRFGGLGLARGQRQGIETQRHAVGRPEDAVTAHGEREQLGVACPARAAQLAVGADQGKRLDQRDQWPAIGAGHVGRHGVAHATREQAVRQAVLQCWRGLRQARGERAPRGARLHLDQCARRVAVQHAIQSRGLEAQRRAVRLAHGAAQILGGAQRGLVGAARGEHLAEHEGVSCGNVRPQCPCRG
jgi:hypothetical protein